MRLSVAAAVCLSIMGAATADPASAAIKKLTNIPAQELGSALQELAHEHDFQVVYLSEGVDKLRTSGAVGDLTADEALKRLLKGTGLVYRYLDEKTVTVQPAAGSPAPSASRKRAQQTMSSEGGASGSLQQDTQPGGLWDRFRVAQLDQRAPTSGGGPIEPAVLGEAGKLEEIVVTAQKREERLLDVPVPVTVLDAQSLVERNQVRVADYLASVPGLNLNANGGGQQEVAIRGIVTGSGANPGVGVTIDDVPFGSSSFNGLATFIDIDPSALQRIEVLRGPQGTLYGASSIGGLIKYVTRDPSVSELTGRVEVEGTNVAHGDSGYGVRGMVNIPVSDQFALLASGFARRDPGFIDNVTAGETDVNRADVYGGGLSALWHLSDNVSLKLGALLQRLEADGSSRVDTDKFLHPLYGDLTQARLPTTEPYSLDAKLYTAELKAKVASIDVTSITAYGTTTMNEYRDVSAAYGYYSSLYFPPLADAPYKNYTSTDKVSEEFRLSSSIGRAFDWLLGGFYTHEKTLVDQPIYAADSAGHVGGLLIRFVDPTSVDEYALFGDLTVHLTDRFDIQFGGRESWDHQVYNEVDYGPVTQDFFGSNPPFVNPTEYTNGKAFTYLVTPRFRISPDLMVYARIASGYRIGGNNYNAAIDNVQSSFAPDRTKNYEIGIKGSVFNQALTFDASAYYINWTDLQVLLIDSNGFGYDGNAGKAKSQGLELSLQAKPTEGLTIRAAGSVNDAELTQNVAAFSFVGHDGDRLPYSSKFSGSLSIDQDVPVVEGWTGYIGGSVNYLTSREGEFVTRGQARRGIVRLSFPAYASVDLRLGVRHDSWVVNLFARNVADKRGISGGRAANGDGQPGSEYEINYIQPRTVGLSVGKVF